MIYANTDAAAISAMERHRTGDYGAAYDPDIRGICVGCGDDITYDEPMYRLSRNTYCMQCFKEVLFEHMAWEYEEAEE